MSRFPGFIFDGEGRPLDDRTSGLDQGKIGACMHRSVVSRIGLAPVALIWLLNDTATFADVPAGILSATLDAVLGGQSVLILSRQSEPGADVRDGLLGALEVAVASDKSTIST